jgi:3',5'-cyclic AMP phosphodiesterase CpdA
MKILHISDLHIGNGVFQTKDLARFLTAVINKENIIYLFISGDIGSRGDVKALADARILFEIILKDTNIQRESIVLVPGNHDMCANGFQAFDELAYSIRRDNLCCFDESSASHINFDDFQILLVNSSYHLDRYYGFIDTKETKSQLDYIKNSNKDLPVICMMHHHLLPVFKNDVSTTRNSYDFIMQLEEYGIIFVLHGHVHLSSAYYLGSNGVKVNSSRSSNQASLGYINGYAIYTIDGKNVSIQNYGIEKCSSDEIFVERQL